jgi:hypothetical protein
MTDQELMQAIKDQWGELLRSIAATCSIPESFFAALIAGESRGEPHATRFEPKVLGDLAAVLLGKKSAYGSIGAQDLLVYVVPDSVSLGQSSVGVQRTLFTVAINRLASLATSQGLVQIMGYESLPFHLSGPAALQSPASELPIAVEMLVQAASHDGLDLSKDFSQMFDVWNTGRPHAPTADPNYIRNGLARMQIYQELP